MREKIQRRNFLKTMAGAGLTLSAVKAVAADMCQITAEQTSGPFYPGESSFEVTNDLTRVPGRAKPASGEVVILLGTVVDTLCRPVVDANVEIWQACASGRYNNPRDPNPAPLDPDFRYWGEAYTDASGAFEFKTIKPGAYPADVDWDRPPHIHVRISRRGYREIITQLYFKGDPLNDLDKILIATPAAQRDALVVDFQPSREQSGVLVGQCQLTIQKV
ncbi:MAG: hypothetical protein AB7F86_18745 [Bdellovibrionales bacterium]